MMMKAFVLFILTAAFVVHGWSGVQLQSQKEGELVCRVTVERSWHVDAATGQTEPEENARCIPITEHGEADDIYDLRLPEWFVREHKTEISRGMLYVKIPGGRLVLDQVEIPDTSEIVVVDEVQVPVVGRRLQQNVGSRRLMVARISLLDSQLGISTSDLESYIFGTSTSSVSVANQFMGCSSNKLMIQPSSLGGVVDIMVNKSISDFSSWRVLRNDAALALKNFAGTSQLTSVADYVMLCLPPGSWSFVASATPGFWRSTYDDKNCGYLSVVMHQLGYSMSLTDSNDIKPLADTTCYMGQYESTIGSPQKCFNAQKHWMLGWFSDKAITVNPTTSPQSFSLATFLDYNSTETTDTVVLNVGNVYLQYNRAKGFNIGTGENKDQVVIVQAQANGQSEKLAGLSLISPVLNITNFANGLNLMIEVCQFNSSRLDMATVSIALGSCACSCSSSALPNGTATKAPGLVPSTMAPSGSATTQASSPAPSRTSGGTAALPAPGFITASPTATAPQASLPTSGNSFLTQSPTAPLASPTPSVANTTSSPTVLSQPPATSPSVTTMAPGTTPTGTTTSPSVATSSPVKSSPAPTRSPTMTTATPGKTPSLATIAPTIAATNRGNVSSTVPIPPVSAPPTNPSPSHPSGLFHPSVMPLFNNSVPTMKPSVFPVRTNSSISPKVNTLYPTVAHNVLDPITNSAAPPISRTSFVWVVILMGLGLLM